MGVETDFDGFHVKLESLNNRIKNHITTRALLEGAQDVLQEQQVEAVARVYDEGRLAASLKVYDKMVGRGLSKRVKVGVNPQAQPKEPGGTKPVLYGHYQEYGTYKMNGKFWMRAAAKDGLPKANKTIKNVIREELGRL